MTSNLGLDPGTLEQLIEKRLVFRPIVTTRKCLYEQYAGASALGQEAAKEMATIAKRFFYTNVGELPQLPPISTAGGFDDPRRLQAEMKGHIRRYAKQLASLWDIDEIGYIEVDAANRSCVFTYNEYERRRGVFTHRIKRTRFRQEMVSIRRNRLPALHVEQPQRAIDIANSLHFFRRDASIWTGTKVLQTLGESDERLQRTALGHTYDRAAAAAKSRAAAAAQLAARSAAQAQDAAKSAAAAAAPVVARVATAAGVAAVGAVALTGIALLGAAALAAAPLAAAAAIADPVLCIANRSLTGWE